MREFCRIAANVTMGDNVSIHAFVNLYGCSIGDNSRIGAFVEIQKNASIGRNVKVSSHTFVCEGVEIEDDCFIGHNVSFINDKYPRATTEGGTPQSEADWQVVPTRVMRGHRSAPARPYCAALPSARMPWLAPAVWSRGTSPITQLWPETQPDFCTRQ